MNWVKAVRTPFRLWRSRVGSQCLVIIRCADQSGCSMFESGCAPLHGAGIIAANGFNDLIRYPRKLFLFCFFFQVVRPEWKDEVCVCSLPPLFHPSHIPICPWKTRTKKKPHFWFITLFFPKQEVTNPMHVLLLFGMIDRPLHLAVFNHDPSFCLPESGKKLHKQKNLLKPCTLSEWNLVRFTCWRCLTCSARIINSQLLVQQFKCCCWVFFHLM